MSNGEALLEEIEEMIGAPTPEETPPAEVPPSDGGEPPAEEPPSETPPAETPPETPPEEPPAETPPGEEPPVTPPAEEPSVEGRTREQILEEQNKLLLQRIEDLTVPQPAQPVAPKPEEKPPETPPETPPVETPPAPPAALEPADFLGELSIDDVIDSKEKFNDLLNMVRRGAIETAEKRVYEKVLTSIPELIMGYVNRKATVDSLVGEFFKANEDLKSVRKTVAAISNDVHAEHPDWTIQDVFKEAGVRTRKVLGMPAPKPKVVKSEGNRFDDPAFAGGSGGRPTPRVDSGSLQEEIDDLLNHD